MFVLVLPDNLVPSSTPLPAALRRKALEMGICERNEGYDGIIQGPGTQKSGRGLQTESNKTGTVR